MLRRHQGLRRVGLIFAVALCASACAATMTRPVAHPRSAAAARRAARAALARTEAADVDAAADEISDDALVDEVPMDTSFYFASRGDDVMMPDFAFTASDLHEDAPDGERLFPAAEGSIDDAMAGTPTVVETYVVSARKAEVRARPDPRAAVVRVLPRGEDLLGAETGAWACVGHNQYIVLEALTLSPQPTRPTAPHARHTHRAQSDAPKKRRVASAADDGR